MHEVICSQCKQTRVVKAKKTWMIGEPPYEKVCKSCCQTGKKLSEETISKLSVPKPEGFGEKVSLQHKKNPHLKDTLVAGAGAGWNRGLEMTPRSDETKKQISESMIGKNKKKES